MANTRNLDKYGSSIVWGGDLKGAGSSGTRYAIVEAGGMNGKTMYVANLDDESATRLPAPDGYTYTVAAAKKVALEYEKNLVKESADALITARASAPSYTALGKLYSAAAAIADAAVREEILLAIDQVRIETVDNVRYQHWVFQGAPVAKFASNGPGGGLDAATRRAAEFAEETKSVATVINMRQEKMADGIWFTPVLHAKYLGVQMVAENELYDDED